MEGLKAINFDLDTIALKKYTSMIERILSGEEVECESCHKGYFKPLYPEAKINHTYVCSNCGIHYHWDPVVNVE